MPRKKNRNPKKEKKKGYATMADCVFPEDIMICILMRLPVKSIIRFKSVCVPWRDLFSTSRFIKMHQDHFTKNHQSVIIHSLDIDKPFQQYHYYQYFRRPLPSESVSLFEIEPNEMKSTTLPECYQWRDFVGCCNGLVCIGLPIFGPQSIVLWNPATRMFKVIGLWKDVPKDRDAEKVSLGFGYDDDRADFKVVWISCLTNYDEVDWRRIEISMTVVGIEVYSVNSDSWTTITPGFQFKLSLEKKKNYAIVNGNPYWVAEVEGNESARNLCGEVLVRFDVKRLVFEIVPLSELNFYLAGMAVLPLVDWNGSLAFLEQTAESFVVVWVFDEGEQTWRENTTLGPFEMNGDFTLQCSRDGKIMGHVTDGKLFVFDQNNGFIKNVEVSQAAHFEVFPYTESLTHIDGMVLWRGGLGDYAWRECEI